MAEPSSPTRTSNPNLSGSDPNPNSLDHWCHNCNKHVPIETLANQHEVVCIECKFGFVESIPAAVTPPMDPLVRSSEIADERILGNQFLHVLRILAQVAREDGVPPPPPPPPPPSDPADDDGFLRIELNGWGNDRYEDDEEEDDEHVHGEDRSEDENEENQEREEEIRRRRRDELHLRLRDFATRARSENRNRFLDWAEILMGLEDNSIEFRFEIPETDRYIGNPGDYVDAAEFEALLQNLAETEGRRGAPPASKPAIEALRNVEIKLEEEVFVCAICKDAVNMGEFAKEMPCGHRYHGDCIVPWLGARNSCPVCRFELPTDDPDYEEERRKGAPPAFGHGGNGGGSDLAGGNPSTSVQ